MFPACKKTHRLNNVKVGRVCPFIFFLCIGHLPDDGWSGQPKHVVCNKRQIYEIYVVVFGRVINELLRNAHREFVTQMEVT